jgi:Zn-dependent peptidase ImmA (M78 family)/DNA-binding XRE family transcriptional regulator
MSVGGRIRLARKAAGLSQRALAAMCDLSAMAISKYEQDLMMPGSAALLAISKSLQVSIEFLLKSTEIKLAQPAYRCRTSMRVKARASVLAKAQASIERYFEVEELLGIEPAFDMPACNKDVVHSLDEVEQVAARLREEWSLGDGPIENLMEVLEAKGIKVAVVQADSAFDAMMAETENGFPVIVVRDDLQGDRQRLSLAHELGHLIVRHTDTMDAEKVAYRFAGAFLVPASAASAELGEKRQRLDVDELCSLKYRYGMSVAAWAYRAKDLGIISDTYFSSFNRSLRMKGLHREEEWCAMDPESTSRRMRLVQRAVAEGLVSRTKARELRDVSL